MVLQETKNIHSVRHVFFLSQTRGCSNVEEGMQKGGKEFDSESNQCNASYHRAYAT